MGTKGYVGYCSDSTYYANNEEERTTNFINEDEIIWHVFDVKYDVANPKFEFE